MSNNIFGTDGIRGKLGGKFINPEFVTKLGYALGSVLTKLYGKSTVLIGKDTRISGYMLESALEAGLAGSGTDIRLLGPMPTPAISYLTKTFRAQAGIVISASHNLYHDNGIKFFASDGRKISSVIEDLVANQLVEKMEIVNSENLGKAARIVDAAGRYIEYCKSTLPSKFLLSDLKIVIDCANGATYHVAPNILQELGAEVVVIANEPDGLNINDNCGATNTQLLRTTVIQEQADIGIALDGDGDRLILIDANGNQCDGDDILCIMAKYYQDSGVLDGGVVGTLMTNLAVEQYLQQQQIDFVRVNVGDKYIIKELLAKNWHLGAEPSGHIINFKISESGDGIISALQILLVMLTTGKSLVELTQPVKKYPHFLCNVTVNNSSAILAQPSVIKQLNAVTTSAGSKVRILVRPSGTEPLVRIMVEGDDQMQLENIIEELKDIITTADVAP